MSLTAEIREPESNSTVQSKRQTEIPYLKLWHPCLNSVFTLWDVFETTFKIEITF